MDEFDMDCFDVKLIRDEAIDDDIDILDDIKKEKFTFINSAEESPSQISDDLNILEKYPDTKDMVVRYFNTFKNGVMKYNNTSFFGCCFLFIYLSNR